MKRLARTLAGKMPQSMVDFLYRHRFNPLVRGARTVGAGRLGDTTKGVLISRGPLAGYKFAFSDSLAMWIGGHETAVVDEILKALEPGMVAYDIGAHVGYTVLLMAHAVGAGGKIVGYEPDPNNHDLLMTNIALNELGDRVTTRTVALGREAGRGSLLRGDLSILTKIESEQGGEVVISTLDEEVYEHSMPPPDLIVIDAEGAEEDIFEGGARMLAEYGPILVCEDHGRRDELIAQLSRFGYVHKHIDVDHVLYRRPKD
ncbi:MAG: FkbM family methyltransferase [Actinomycetota bacterium]|nr:FkbM family methyltransferase [Actinomycetota bacterium]